MPKKWGVNSKAEEAREKEKQQKKEKQIHEEEKKESKKWEEDDKNVLKQLQRKQENDKKKNEESQRKLENKKLYEEEMNSFVSNKQSKNQKITKADIKKNQEDALLKAMEKKLGISEKPKKTKQNSDDSSDDDNPPLEPNLNHIQREQAILDAEKYSEVIDARGLDDALNKLGGDKPEKHPEKRVKAAFENYVEEQLPILKKEYPSLKRSQLMEIIQKNVRNF